MQPLINLIAQEFQQHLTESIKQCPTGLIITTMEEEPTIITELYRAAAQHDLDIMEYTLHSKMIQDEDENYITTMTFYFHQILN